jgi:hypothetical protein
METREKLPKRYLTTRICLVSFSAENELQAALNAML